MKPKTSPPRAPVLRLRLHGGAHVAGADGSSLPLRGRAAALVALAALEPGIRRERAAALLWPESPSARQNLRQQLLRFRQALGAALIDGDDQLRLAPGVQLQTPAPGARLLADEDGFDEALGLWLEGHRQADNRAQLQPLLDERERAEASGDLDRALRCAQELVALEPQQEPHHAALMRLHYLRGEPAAGLVVYQRLADVLQAGVGSRPAAATQDLAGALRRMGQLPAAAAAVAVNAAARSLPVTLTRPPVMAGRGAELAEVQAAWGAGRAVLVEGEAGMGKSRLLAECLSGLPGPALQGAGRPGDSGAPYSTLVRLLQPLLGRGVAQLSVAAQDALARIGVGDAGAPASAPRALASGAMQAAVAELLDHAGVRAVALDDLHFADAATLELLSGLAAPATARQWLFAHRPAEAPPAAKALRHMLTECLRLSVVTLSPLDERAAAELVDALALQGLQGDALAPALVRHSGGNPLFLLETLKQGLVDGSLARGELPRPANVGALIEQRLQRLSEPALALARVAAIAGVDFSIELAEAAIGQSAVQLASAWRELQDAQVLRDEALAHDLVADAALHGVPPVVARRVHAQCASWLARHGGDQARAARHWLLGNRPAEAAQAFEAAARRAHAASRPGEEAELYQQAATAHGASGQPQARFEALASRVSALIGARADDAALAEARALPAQAHNDLQRVRAARVLADLVGQRGPFEESVEISLQGAALARRIGEQHELVRLVCVAAGNLLKIGRAPEGYSMLLPLREWVDQHAADDLRQIWYGYWAAALGHTGRLREGVASYDVAIACAERAGEPAVVSMALLNQSVVLRTMGALERAFEGSRRGLALSSDEADNAHHRMARLMHARNEAETGRFCAAQQALDELLPQFEAMGAPFWVHAVRMTQVRLWQHLGQHTRALQALQLDDADMPAWLRAGRLWLKLEVQHWLGQRAEPQAATQALALLDGDPHRNTGNAVRGLRFAEPPAVLEQAARLADRAQEQELFGTLAALQLHRARSALALQRHGEAADAARALLELLHQGHAPDFVYGPEAWLVAARALAAGGDARAARAAWTSGQVWVRQQALPQVPAPFIDSFLHRNPVNRELLATAAPPLPHD